MAEKKTNANKTEKRSASYIQQRIVSVDDTHGFTLEIDHVPQDEIQPIDDALEKYFCTNIIETGMHYTPDI